MSEKQKNVLGEELEDCSQDPLTGWSIQDLDVVTRI